MSIFGSLFTKKSKSKISFNPLLENKFLNKEEYLELESQIINDKPISKVLYDFSPKCLHKYVWNKVNEDYNYRYFKKSYFEYVNRIPFWAAESISSEVELKIKKDQQELLEALKKGNLISLKTYYVINEAASKGIIYKLWEIIEIASNLTKNEEEFQTFSILNELQPFVNEGYILSTDVIKIKKMIQEKEINLSEQIFELFGKNVRIEALNQIDNEEEFIKSIIGQCLKALPFYRNHSIIQIDYHKDLKDPYHKDFLINHTTITLDFNGISHVFSFRTDQHSYKISENFDVLVVPRILNYLCEKENKKYNVYINNNYKFGIQAGENTNINSYDIFIFESNLYKSFLLKNKLAISKFISKEDKKQYLTSLLNSLDPERYSIGQKNEIERQVYNSDFNSLDQIPYFIENFATIIWRDDLADEYNYENIINNFITISNKHFAPLKVSELKANEDCLLSIVYNNKDYSCKLLKESVDYGFVKLLGEIQTQNDLNGNFYTLNDYNIEDGYCFIFLSKMEYNNLSKLNLIKISEIEKIHNIWLDKN